jgi:hypothetical protein
LYPANNKRILAATIDEGGVRLNLKLALPEIHGAAPPDGTKILARDLKNGLFVAYLISDNGATRYVAPQDLSLAGMTLAELHKFSALNLVAGAQKKPPDIVRMEKGAFAVLWDFWQEASLILLEEIWDEGSWGLTPGGPIVGVPRQDVLAFCDARSSPALAELREMTRQALHGENAITGELFCRRQSAWVRYTD